jgi:hypothetical protein
MIHYVGHCLLYVACLMYAFRDLTVFLSPSHAIILTSIYTRESKKLSALLFFQFIYTNVGVEQVCVMVKVRIIFYLPTYLFNFLN